MLERDIADPRIGFATVTQTLACRRSGVVSTSVIVANPTRGSAISRDTISPISCRSSSSTRSVRWLISVTPQPDTSWLRQRPRETPSAS